jgi:LmbE family N-acetylglucosaminyl deacetylase
MDTVSEPHYTRTNTPEPEWQSWFDHHPLRSSTAQQMFSQYARVVLLAPHPNDAVLGCAGILMMLEQLHIPCSVVFVSDGKTPASEISLKLLSPNADIMRLHIPNGTISRARNRLYHQLSHFVEDHDLLICPWEYDGHPDHEAVADVALELALLKHIAVMRIPIRTWHWCAPDNQSIPWDQACRLPLDAAMQAKKAVAISVFRRQIQSDTTHTQRPILPDHVLAHYLRPFELVFL